MLILLTERERETEREMLGVITFKLRNKKNTIVYLDELIVLL